MSITRELIQRLSDHTGVSFEDAKAALEACGGDMLDALSWLERAGKIPASGIHSYATDTGSAPPPEEEPYEREQPARGTFLRSAWRWLVDNRLEILRRSDGVCVLECPIVALAALLILAWWLVLVLLGVGYLLGWRYRFAGPNLGRSRVVQDVMEQIDNGMTSMVDDVMRNIRGR